MRQLRFSFGIFVEGIFEDLRVVREDRGGSNELIVTRTIELRSEGRNDLKVTGLNKLYKV